MVRMSMILIVIWGWGWLALGLSADVHASVAWAWHGRGALGVVALDQGFVDLAVGHASAEPDFTSHSTTVHCGEVTEESGWNGLGLGGGRGGLSSSSARALSNNANHFNTTSVHTPLELSVTLLSPGLAP